MSKERFVWKADDFEIVSGEKPVDERKPRADEKTPKPKANEED